jgi:hypothetical protein
VLTSAGNLSVLLCAAQSLMNQYPYALDEMLYIVINVLLLHEVAWSANSVKGCQQRRNICFIRFYLFILFSGVYHRCGINMKGFIKG